MSRSLKLLKSLAQRIDQRHRMSRLATFLLLALLVSPGLTALQKMETPPPFVKIPPEVAASHILKKVEPLYPAFAKAAGIEGMVGVHVDIYQDGRIHEIQGAVSGWACLGQAAMDAAGQYEFKPFEKDGQPVVADTIVNVVFRLPEPKTTVHLPPPPPMPDRFDSFRDADPAADLSPAVRNWLDSYLRASHLGHTPFFQQALDSSVAVEIPTKNAATRLYILSQQAGAPICGATGNCPIELVEQSSHGVRLLVDPAESGEGFYAHTHEGSLYPDVFIVTSMSAFESDVNGYSNVRRVGAAVLRQTLA